MPPVKRRAFGVVPVAMPAHGSAEYLILRAYKNWDFPKGTAEAGEAPLATALRELREETGIEDVSWPWGQRSMDTAIYAGDKVATYFIGRVDKRRLILPVSAESGRPEHQEYRWTTRDQAGVLLPARLLPILEWAAGIVAAAWDKRR